VRQIRPLFPTDDAISLITAFHEPTMSVGFWDYPARFHFATGLWAVTECTVAFAGGPVRADNNNFTDNRGVRF